MRCRIRYRIVCTAPQSSPAPRRVAHATRHVPYGTVPIAILAIIPIHYNRLSFALTVVCTATAKGMAKAWSCPRDRACSLPLRSGVPFGASISPRHLRAMPMDRTGSTLLRGTRRRPGRGAGARPHHTPAVYPRCPGLAPGAVQPARNRSATEGRQRWGVVAGATPCATQSPFLGPQASAAGGGS